MLAGGGALIPPDRNYRQQLKVYENRTRAAGLYRMHGLRHHYALTRYQEITGWKAPAAGGPSRRPLRSPSDRRSILDSHNKARLDFLPLGREGGPGEFGPRMRTAGGSAGNESGLTCGHGRFRRDPPLSR